jgi:hypothetical protein
MQEDEEFDETLLVETLLGGPDVSHAAPYSPIGELVIYAAPISLILAAIVVAVAYCGPPGTVDEAMRALYIFVTAGSWVPWGSAWRFCSTRSIVFGTQPAYQVSPIIYLRATGLNCPARRALRCFHGAAFPVSSKRQKVPLLSGQPNGSLGSSPLPARRRRDQHHPQIHRQIRRQHQTPCLTIVVSRL